MRVAFVGQSTFFAACALGDGVVPGIETTFVEHRKDADPAALTRAIEAYGPDVIVAFRPEVLPPGVFAHRGTTPVLGFLTEPLPRTGTDGAVRHEDLERRLWELQQVDATNVDRVVTFDPNIAAAAQEVMPVWRSLPLPVADRYYRDVTRLTGPPRAVFVGRSTPHRERVLEQAKHQHDVLHLAFGVDADELERVMDGADVAINVHNEPYPSFENRVCLHLAAGHLVLSEPLSPTHGLEPGIDYLEFDRPYRLTEQLTALQRTPGLWHAVRSRGRRKAEQFRASRVWPRLLADLQHDLDAFGRGQHAA